MASMHAWMLCRVPTAVEIAEHTGHHCEKRIQKAWVSCTFPPNWTFAVHVLLSNTTVAYLETEQAGKRTSIHKVEAGKVPDLHIRQTFVHTLHELEDPLILLLPISILARPQRMRDALKGIGERARKVVGWVALVLCACPPVGVVIAAVCHRVSQTRVRI